MEGSATGVMPPSRTRSTSSPSCSAAPRAEVWCFSPDLLALVLTMTPPESSANLLETSWPGTRNPRVLAPWVTQMEYSTLAGRTSIRGPGQNSSASLSAAGLNSTVHLAASISEHTRGRGLSARPFMKQTFFAASGIWGAQPRP